MPEKDKNGGETTVVMNAELMSDALDSIARQVVASNPKTESIVFLGILERGRPLAERLAKRIEEITGAVPCVGSLATTLYRDDLRAGMGAVKLKQSMTHFDFNVDGKTVILVDDVISAGRTVRAALDEVMDYGRPERIQLACMVDRGHRELPIQADYLGCAVDTQPQDHIAVKLNETDGEDVVLHIKRTCAGNE